MLLGSSRLSIAAAAVVLIAAVSLAASSTGTTATRSAVPIVAIRCNSAIIIYPPASPGPTDRDIFGRVFVAGRDYVAAPNPQPSGAKPFVFYAKTGISIRRGSEALVELPKVWRRRVAIEWGDSGNASRIRFPACRAGPAWITYAGGFNFRSASGGCVPLRVTVQLRSKTVLFSAGRHC